VLLPQQWLGFDQFLKFANYSITSSARAVSEQLGKAPWLT